MIENIINKLYNVLYKEVVMKTANYSTVRQQFKKYCDEVVNDDEELLVKRNGGDVVIINLKQYNEFQKARNNAAYLAKINESKSQIEKGLGKITPITDFE